MRYPQGGGLTAERRAFREGIRARAVGLFAAGVDNAAIAGELRVSVRSVHGMPGPAGLRSKGSAARLKLSPVLWTALEAEFDRGPAAHGWPDQTWTLARIQTLIGRRFHKRVSLSGICQMLARNGWTHQSPARTAVERDDDAVASWVRETWPRVEKPRRRSAPGSSSKTKPGSR